MDNSQINAIIAIVASFVLLAASFRFFGAYNGQRKFNSTRFIARVAIFGAFASILYVLPIFTINLPFIPSFLSLHFDEIPCFIAGFAYGPLSGISAILIKTLVKLPLTSTVGVGELTDLLLSGAYVGIAALIYKKKRNLKGVAIAFSVATLFQIVVAMFLNVYLMIPFYMNLYGIDEAGLLTVMQLANPAIKDIGWSYAFFAVLPFNLLKDVIVIIVTFFVYRSIHKLLRFER